MNSMLNNIQTTTALPPSIFIQDKDSTEHNTNITIKHNTYFDPRALFHCPIKCRLPGIFCSMVVEEPQVQPPDEWASLCERFRLHQSEEGLQAIHCTSVSHNGPSCTMRNATVKWWNTLLPSMGTTHNTSFVHLSVLCSSEISPTRCNNCVFVLRNGFTLHVSGDNLTHHQEYICCIWSQVSRHLRRIKTQLLHLVGLISLLY